MKALESRLPGAAEQEMTYVLKTTGSKTPVLELSSELRRIVGVDLLKIPGVGPLTAQIVLSEIGTDMSHWPTEKHFASWLGLCPDHRISGGRILARSTRPVVNRARNALRIAVYSLERSKTGIGAKYRRLKSKLGAPKAIVAMAHHPARMIYRMINSGRIRLKKQWTLTTPNKKNSGFTGSKNRSENWACKSWPLRNLYQLFLESGARWSVGDE